MLYIRSNSYKKDLIEESCSKNDSRKRAKSEDIRGHKTIISLSKESGLKHPDKTNVEFESLNDWIKVPRGVFSAVLLRLVFIVF